MHWRKFSKKESRSNVWVDKGREFFNKEVHKLITLYSTENEEKSIVVERLNRTMKEKVFRYFFCKFHQEIHRYFRKLVEEYNNTKHSSIGIRYESERGKSNEKRN